MKKYLKIENLLYLYILLSPFLDSFSFIYRSNFTSTISPITVLRPIIPIILSIYLFFKNKKSRKILIIGGVVYLAYGLGHLYIYNNNITGITYGGLLHEAQYIINYTYMILLLYIFIKFDNMIDVLKLKKILLITLSCYLGLIYLSLITSTSSHTYIEGIGYKGWNLSGNSIGTVLLLLECLTITYISNKSKKIFVLTITIMTLLGIFLTYFLGTRTGLFGFYLVLGVYFIGNIVLNFIKKQRLDLVKNMLPLIVVILIGFGSIFLIGSSTISRREHMQDVKDDIYDKIEHSPAHVTGDTVSLVTQIKNNEVEDGFMSEEVKKAYLSLYEYANKHEFASNDLRRQQLIYHLNLVKYQKSVPMLLFGNGYEINYGEMTLEMEVLAILLNFGLFGFILFLIPFIIIDVKGIIYILKSIHKLDIEMIMYLLGSFLAYTFSLLAGYTFFNPSSSLLIIIIHMLIIRKYKEKL